MLANIVIGGLFSLIGGLLLVIFMLLNRRIGKLEKDMNSKSKRFLDKVSVIDGELSGKDGIYVDLAEIKKDIESLQEKV